MFIVEHSLYGKCKFNKKVKKETNCVECVHNKVCRYDLAERCFNYEFGTSEGKLDSCPSCIHRYTRWRQDNIPCFKCKDFLAKKQRNK